ncbi:RNA polymerase sigma factor [Larkinella arboricola]
MLSLPTSTILTKLRNGEDVEQITRYLYKTYERPLKGYIRKMGGSSVDAEDIVQEVMIAFLRRVLSDTFEERQDTKLESYLIGIARRKWLKKMEGDHRRLERQYQFTKNAGTPNTPEQMVEEGDYRQWAWEQFQLLGEKCRLILTAFYRDELSLEKIAELYELGTAQAVKMRKFRCIQKLLKLTDYAVR